MSEQLIFHDEIKLKLSSAHLQEYGTFLSHPELCASSGQTFMLHELPDDPYFEPLPMKLAAYRPCILEDDDDEGPTCQDGPSLLNFSLSQSDVQLPSGTTHVLIPSTLSSVLEHLSDSTAATPTIATSESLLRCPAADIANVRPDWTSVFTDRNVMELHHQSSDLGPTNGVKPHSCAKKKRTKGKKRARDASGTEENNGGRQTKRKKGKGSKGTSGVLPLSGRDTNKASWGSGGTRSLERRVLEDITNKVLHAVT
ncbi:hypothetical protein EV421DRAFT_1211416 [Armillaria borealis]|uniref:Uncharacterized protein n=1 Tax=Armillaria borealis TaxID=47425 RepID=A0AA39MY86_9AGAR|nr:hypothetical protein EV421DRAFT_1211416 [Armillaria borealis]